MADVLRRHRWARGNEAWSAESILVQLDRQLTSEPDCILGDWVLVHAGKRCFPLLLRLRPYLLYVAQGAGGVGIAAIQVRNI